MLGGGKGQGPCSPSYPPPISHVDAALNKGEGSSLSLLSISPFFFLFPVSASLLFWSPGLCVFLPLNPTGTQFPYLCYKA